MNLTETTEFTDRDGVDWADSAVRDGALVVDLSGMRTVEVAGEVARVGGGATGDDLPVRQE